MAGVRWLGPRRSALALGLSVVLLVVLVTLVRFWSARSEVVRPDPEPVLTVAAGEVVGGVAVEDSVVVVLSTGDGSAAGRTGEATGVDGDEVGLGRTTLVRLDRATGGERQRVVLGPWTVMDGMDEVDGDLVLRLRGRLAEVPGQPLPTAEAEEAAAFDGDVWLTVVDGSTLAPIRQYQLPPFQRLPTSPLVSEPLIIVDGVYWMLGASSRRARIDVRTGDTRLAQDVFDRPISGVTWTETHLVVTAWGIVRVIDRATGEIVTRSQLDRFPIVAEATQPVDFRVHEGQVWVAPLIRDVDDLPLRLDLDSGLLVDERPSTAIPGWSFDSGGWRWELTGRRVVSTDRQVPAPESDDQWRQVDPSTGEVVARFDLGSWQPVFATPEHLWVTGSDPGGVGTVLARIELGRASGPTS